MSAAENDSTCGNPKRLEKLREVRSVDEAVSAWFKSTWNYNLK